MKKLSIITAFVLIFITLSAQNNEPARWLRFPAISPDGATIAFGYMGNIYTVGINGGKAQALTVGDTHSERPVWSRDGKTIAFRNDRFGNFDIFTMPATGGQSTRITYHSGNDFVYDFNADNQSLLIGSNREAPAASVRFPGIQNFQNLYSYPINGSRPQLITAAGAESARYNGDGTKIVFQDKKGYEDEWRKHHTSSITRDIWIYDIPTNQYKKLTNFKGEDRNPMFANDSKQIYYTSEENGTLNIYKMNIDGSNHQRLTNFTNFPVRSLSISNNNLMTFEWKGDIYTYIEGENPKKIDVIIPNNSGFNHVSTQNVNNISEFAISPNGKEVAYIIRGELFVSGVDNKFTKRITNTPGQERMVGWSPDGSALIYAGELNHSWNIYKVTLANSDEKFFYASTLLKTEILVASNNEEFRAKYSPDGKKIAYIENRNVLKVLDIKSGDKITILPEGHNFSYSDGDWSFEWSPDSEWLLVDDSKGFFSSSNTALLPADGKGRSIYPINSGFGDSSAKWAMEGKAMTYKSAKLGRKSLAYQGSYETDIYIAFFDVEAFDNFKLSKDELALINDQKNDKEKKKEEKEKEKAEKKEPKQEKLNLKLDGIRDRIVRLTINSASISDYVLTKDGSKLYYLSAFEKGYDLWVTEPRTRETKILAKMGSNPSRIQLSADEKSLFLISKGAITKVETATGKTSKVATDASMTIDPAKEREYIFEHMWRQVREKFYDPAIHGIDWQMYKDEYSQLLPHVNNNYDFQVLLSEMLGELNASHTGARYSPRPVNGDSTPSFGLLFDEKYMGEGVKVTEALVGGPCDKAESKMIYGDIIMKVNGEDISKSDNWYKIVNNLTSGNVLFTVKRKHKTVDVKVKPITQGVQNALLYKRWIAKMEHLTDSLSNGRVGYVHVQGMNDNSFREVYDKVMGPNIEKKALIVDTRFNGGGWLHNDLNTFLSGNDYLKFAPQGKITKGGEPTDRWSKPSIVLMSEGNYSDAFIFPYVYKQNKIGKLVGMPVAGTGTAVWWETQIDPTIVFGIPMVATIGDENRPTENLDLEPDIIVELPYNEFLNGKDSQLERAVKEMLKEIEK